MSEVLSGGKAPCWQTAQKGTPEKGRGGRASRCGESRCLAGKSRGEVLPPIQYMPIIRVVYDDYSSSI